MPQRPVSPAPVPGESSREAIPVTTYSTRQQEYGSSRAGTVIGKNLVVTGHIHGKEDVVIDGRLEGDVILPENRLTVGASGQVQGGIRSREIVVHGIVQGNLEASERVEIKKNAKVIGDLKAARPVIEDEAYFKGNVETIRVETPKPQPQPQPQPQAPPRPQPAAAPAASEAQASLLTPEARPEPKR